MGAIGSILGIGATAMTSGTSGVAGVNPAQATQSTGATGAAGSDFGNIVTSALDNLDAVQGNADSLAVKAATGDLNDVQDYMIAASQASLATQFTVALRDRAVEAFNDIMKMQI